jgi:hypothetical protein
MCFADIDLWVPRNCETLPNELAPAAYVLNDTTRDAEQLWDDAESWYMRHEHTPKEVQS